MLRSTIARGPTDGVVMEWIGYAALGLEFLAAVIIVVTVLVATVRHVAHFVNTHRIALPKRPGSQAEEYKRDVAGGMMLALELLIAADILRTVTMDFALETILVLGLLILIRTFLMWSLIVEIEHRWPWQRRRGGHIGRYNMEPPETKRREAETQETDYTR
jgi:uncharacterized membrane protein